MSSIDAVARARAEVGRAVAALAEGRARDEAVGEFVPAGRWLIFPRRARMRSVGRVWRLGVLLLDATGTLRATGDVIRAVRPKHPNHQSALADRRREYQLAAYRGHFRDGETVNFAAPVIPLERAALASEAGPLVLAGDEVFVRWAAGSAVPLGPYLRERVGLLLESPAE